MDNVKPIIDLLTALMSPIVAITVTYIAYQQWKINASKETREIRTEKLHIYLSVKRFLSHIDETRIIDPILYKEFQEASALADFIFDADVIDWLFDVDSNASSWLDGENMRIQHQEKAPLEFLQKEEMRQDKIIDKLQTAHCQLLDVFKDKVIGKQT